MHLLKRTPTEGSAQPVRHRAPRRAAGFAAIATALSVVVVSGAHFAEAETPDPTEVSVRCYSEPAPDLVLGAQYQAGGTDGVFASGVLPGSDLKQWKVLVASTAQSGIPGSAPVIPADYPTPEEFPGGVLQAPLPIDAPGAGSFQLTFHSTTTQCEAVIYLAFYGDKFLRPGDPAEIWLRVGEHGTWQQLSNGAEQPGSTVVTAAAFRSAIQ